MDNQLAVQQIQELVGHPAWKLYQAHLDKLCRVREVEKAGCLRLGKHNEAVLKQGEIDGITLSAKSISSLITSLSPQTEQD